MALPRYVLLKKTAEEKNGYERYDEIDEIDDRDVKKAADRESGDGKVCDKGAGIRREDQQKEVLQDDGETERNQKRRIHVLSQDAVDKIILDDEPDEEHCRDDENQGEQRADIENREVTKLR